MLFMGSKNDHVNLNDQDPMQELRGWAILDTGCPITVCGQEWLDSFMKDMSDEEGLQVKVESSNQRFIFGDGKIVLSKKRTTILCWMGQIRGRVCMEVVDCNIPLLLSWKEMKKKGMVLDFGVDELRIGNKITKLGISRSGHYALPIYRGELKKRADVKRVY